MRPQLVLCWGRGSSTCCRLLLCNPRLGVLLFCCLTDFISLILPLLETGTYVPVSGIC